MTGLERILAEITEEAQETARQTILKAQAEARKIEEEARRTCEEEMRRAEEAIKQADAQIKVQTEAAAQRSAKRIILKEKQSLIAQTIQTAKQTTETMETADYFAYMGKLLERYAHKGETGELILSKADKERATEAFLKQAAKLGLTLSAEEGQWTSGFCIRYGGVEENCTIGALIDEKQETLTEIVQVILFPKEGEDT